jgi:hypothetical protein
VTRLEHHDYRHGDIVLCHGKGVISWAIRVGERLRHPKHACHWNHAGILMRPVAHRWDPDWWVLAAGPKGVGWNKLSEMGENVVVSSRLDTRGRNLACEFAQRACGRKYGWLTIASILFNLATPNIWDFHRPGTFICSGLAARAMGQGGYAFPITTDMDQVMPADLAIWLRAPATGL